MGEYQVLSHAEGAIRMDSFRKAGVPFLREHSTYDQLGTVEGENASINNGKLYVSTVVWRTGDYYREAEEDFKKGAIRNISVRAKAYASRALPDYEGERQVEFTDWEVVEISLVGIPADNSVGVGRSATVDVSHEETEARTMPDTKPTEAQVQAEVERQMKERLTVLNDRQDDFIRRMDYIDEMATQHDLSVETVRKLRGEKADENAVLKAVVARQAEVAKSRVNPETGEPEPIAASNSPTFEAERSRYNLGEVLRGMASGDRSSKAMGLAMEVSRELAQGVGLPEKTLMVPYGALVKHEDLTPDQLTRSSRRHQEIQRAFSTTGAGAGGAESGIIPTSLDTTDFIDALRARVILMRLGVRVLSGLQGNLDVGRMDTGSGTKWLPSPTGSADGNQQNDQVISNTQPVAGVVPLVPRRLASLVPVSNFTLQQSPLVIEDIVRRDMMAAISVGMQNAIFTENKGQPVQASDQPANLLSLIGNRRTGAAQGTPNAAVTLNYNRLVDLVGEVGQVDGIIDENSTALVGPWIARQSMWKVAAGRNAGSYPLLTPGGSVGRGADGTQTLPVTGLGEVFGTTNSVAHGYAVGSTANANAFSIWYGDWSQFILGMWGAGMQVTVGTNTNDFGSDRVSFRAISTTGWAVRHPESFRVLGDLNSP